MQMILEKLVSFCYLMTWPIFIQMILSEERTRNFYVCFIFLGIGKTFFKKENFKY